MTQPEQVDVQNKNEDSEQTSEQTLDQLLTDLGLSKKVQKFFENIKNESYIYFRAFPNKTGDNREPIFEEGKNYRIKFTREDRQKWYKARDSGGLVLETVKDLIKRVKENYGAKSYEILKGAYEVSLKTKVVSQDGEHIRERPSNFDNVLDFLFFFADPEVAEIVKKYSKSKKDGKYFDIVLEAMKQIPSYVAGKKAILELDRLNNRKNTQYLFSTLANAAKESYKPSQFLDVLESKWIGSGYKVNFEESEFRKYFSRYEGVVRAILEDLKNKQ